ncbi:hypothetical protein PGQ11_002946 [Apiospora arundinis]|uniref:Uncharacterized protein n=1 Tax=Apiospora arundinis TaxID=335852 RepID=A0ABR2J453_9PEZI
MNQLRSGSLRITMANNNVHGTLGRFTEDSEENPVRGIAYMTCVIRPTTAWTASFASKCRGRSPFPFAVLLRISTDRTYQKSPTSKLVLRLLNTQRLLYPRQHQITITRYLRKQSSLPVPRVLFSSVHNAARINIP